MLANAELQAVPLTIHSAFCCRNGGNAEFYADNLWLEDGLHRYFGCDSRMAVTGLNPHAGESGHIGRFEADTCPANHLPNQKGRLSGPHSADSLFH